MFELQILGPWENVIQVKCHIGISAAFVRSTQNVPMARAAARVRFRKDLVQAERNTRKNTNAERGKKGRSLFWPVLKGQIQRRLPEEKQRSTKEGVLIR